MRVLSAIVERNGLDPALVDDVLVGCVVQAGEQSLNIGRSAVLGAGFPCRSRRRLSTVPASRASRAVHLAAQGVAAGAYDVVIAAGVESMSRVPMGLNAMGKDPFGPEVHARYPEGLVNQGVSAELVAQRWKIDRDTLDAYSAESHRRATEAIEAGVSQARSSR